MRWLYEESFTTGRALAAPPALPAAFASSSEGVGRFRLITAIHPRCPCSLATLENLAQLASRHPDQLRIDVLMFQPPHAEPAWTRGRAWDAAARIPGVTITPDLNGELAASLGAVTSGASVAYDPNGRLVMSGGLTPSRGHAGWSPGIGLIDEAIAGSAGAADPVPAYGCPLSECESQGDTP